MTPRGPRGVELPWTPLDSKKIPGHPGRENPRAPLGPGGVIAFFDKLRRHEYEQTGQEWVALQKREFLFQRVSVAVARGNTMILNTMRQGWHSYKRSKETRGVMPKAVLNTSERSHVAQTILSGC